MSPPDESSSAQNPEHSSSDTLRRMQEATAKHAGPFATLEVPLLPREDVRALYHDYVIPFYMRNLSDFGREQEAAFERIRASLDDRLITTLLSDFNWRSRTAATYFALILERPEHLDHIGRLLLRSDVCFAGVAYCRYLAHFRTPEAIDFLNRYLAYYLTQTHLYFDQPQALAALRHIDSVTGSRHQEIHAAALTRMITTRPDFLSHVNVGPLKADLLAAAKLRDF